MKMITIAINAAAVFVMPFFLTGVVNRVKAWWAGRRGASLFQPAYDALRLARKSSVYSKTTTPIFRIAPWIFLITSVVSAAVTPLFGSLAFVSFPFDFVWFAYAWALGRVVVMLAALDTGSSFEGMGAAREATFSTLLEPALFLVAGALCLGAHAQTLRDALLPRIVSGDGSPLIWVCSVVTLFIVLQVENARLPVDDPTTHLELTMVHEVMILDHSGPELAAIQYGAALKLYVCTSILATLLNPFAHDGAVAASLGYLTGCVVIAILVGSIESLAARMRLRSVPKYIAVGLVSAIVALLATTWLTGGSS